MIIINARIFPMDRAPIPCGFVKTNGGVIEEIGGMPYAGETDDLFDAGGASVYPGFVDAHTHIGMWEDGLGFEGDDGNEDTDPSTPHLRAVDAVNPLDRCFAEAREAGVTTVVTGPGSANPIGGQLCALKTYGRRVDDMVVKAPVAMKMALGENPKTTYHGKSRSPVTRMATAAIIRGALAEAQRYGALQEKAGLSRADGPAYNAKCEALLPVLRGELPVHFHAHRLDDIFTAERIAEEFRLQYVIIHGTQAHVAADLIAGEHMRVLCGPLLCDRSKPELKDLTPANPAFLHQAGVELAIITDHPVIPVQYLAVCAGLAVREGLPYGEALNAITLAPARICGIADRVGSITPGKDADLVLFRDDPLSMAAKPAAVFARGQRVRMERGDHR